MESRATKRSRVRALGCGAALLLAVACVGCGSNDDSDTATPVPAASPTPTAEPEGPELHFGSTANGSGALALANEDDLTVKVFSSACLGGTGPNCDGGIVVYIGSEPGFPAIEEDDPAQPLYTLNDGTQVSLLVMAIDQNVTLMFGDATLDAAGQSSVLGTTPGLHADGSWRVTAPGGTQPANRSVTLQLTTSSGAYTASAPFTITLVPSAAEGG